MAKLYFRYGAMNSGKTTALLQVAYNYEERGQEVLLIKSSIDKKGDDHIVSRLGASRKVDLLADEQADLYEHVMGRGGRALNDCIIVDEAQFLTPKQVDELFALTVEGLPVIAYGLRNDFQTNLFPGSARLLALAHSIEELKTICRCGKKAIFNGRRINGQWTHAGDQVAIDQVDDVVTYESLCGACFDTLIRHFHEISHNSLRIIR